MMMMINKTIEELEKELHKAKTQLSYHKNKDKPKRRNKRQQSQKARAHALSQQIVWNDEKRAMSHVIAKLTTTNDKDYNSTRNQAYRMPIEEVRNLAKGYEKEVAEDVKQRQEKREAKKVEQGLAASQEILADEHKWEPLQPLPVPVKKTIPKSRTPNYGDSEETCTAVPVKKITLRLAIEVVSAMTGFEGLSNEQVVGHILNRYLQYNKEKKI
jgi:hypothetical protein|tara:strand:- start:328 stop:969 length:642 start_codon:yes stop_codon:yes gene_type:complete